MYLRILCLLCLCLAPPLARAAAVAGPKATLQRLNGDVDKLLRKKVAAGSPEENQIKQEVKRLAAELLNYEELGKRALGEHWAKLTPKQQTDFIASFKELIERNYIKQLRTNLDYEVKYGEETQDGDEAKVTTTIKLQTKGKPTEALVEYRLLRGSAGRWTVYDVITDELSLVRNYRSQFKTIIGQQGYEGLIKRIKEKLNTKAG